MPRHPWSWLLPMLCSTLAGAVAARDLATAAVTQEALPLEQRFEGVLEAVNRATVSAQTSGRIVEVLFDVDDYVERGAVLFKFSATEQNARHQQAQASLEEAVARLREAENERARIAGIYAKRLVAKAAMDKADAELKAARARHESAAARAAETAEQLEHTVVRAPYSGIVVERHSEVGELANPGQPLMTGISLEHLRAVTAVPQHYIATARAATEARVYASDRKPLVSSDITVSPYADPKAHSFRVRVNLPAAEPDGLYPGMLVKVGFATGTQQRLLLPAQAVVRRSEVTAVYVVDDTGTVRFRQVRVGDRQTGDRVVVLAGLEAGETVATDPVAAGEVLKAQQADRHP